VIKPVACFLLPYYTRPLSHLTALHALPMSLPMSFSTTTTTTTTTPQGSGSSGSSSGTPPDLQQLITDLYSLQPSPAFSIHVTGGGVAVLQWLLTVPGASNCVLDAQVPYARSALASFMAQVGVQNP
jgi:hypothetical protein